MIGESLSQPDSNPGSPRKTKLTKTTMSSLIQRWLDDQNRPSTRRLFNIYFTQFWTWVQHEGLFESPEAMLQDFERRSAKEQYEHVENIKRFMRKEAERGQSSNSRKTALTALRNLYTFNHTPLPKISRSDLRKMFEPSEKEKEQALERRPVRLDELKSALMEAEEPYRTIFQLMYQGGIGLAEFQLFNKRGWSQIKEQLDKPGPMKITLFREKVAEKGVKTYYTFLGEEAKEKLKHWLNIRQLRYGPMHDGEPIFLTSHKFTKKITAPATITIQINMIRCLRKAGLVAKDAKGPFNLHCHELRDIFKSMCTLAGVNKVASEFFLGHDIDKLGYDKSPDYDVDFFKNEYLKVEPKLNLWAAKPSELIKEATFEKKLAELKELGDRVQRLENILTAALTKEGLSKEAIEDLLAGRDRLVERLERRGLKKYVAEE